MSGLTLYKRWRLLDGATVDDVAALVRQEIVPHYRRLSTSVQLGLERLDDRHVLAVQRWVDRASYDAAFGGASYEQWWRDYRPILARWDTLVDFVDEWEGEDLLASDRRSVLVIGLDPWRVPGPWDPEPVVAAVAQGMAALRAAGYDAEECLVGIDGSDDVARVVSSALGRREWDCVVVGGGIRKAEELLTLFEQVVNQAHRLAPHATLAFNDRPDDFVTAVERARA